MNSIVKELDTNKLPKHIAIIMDGNGRWAQQHGHERSFGHKNGVESVRSIIEGAGEIGIQYLTLYAFSTENWNRPKEEIEMLMGLLVQAIQNELEKLKANHVRLMVTGRMQDLPEACRVALQDAINQTADNKGLTLVLALSYSGRSELTDATQAIAQEVKNGTLQPENITAETISHHLYHNDIPDPSFSNTSVITTKIGFWNTCPRYGIFDAISAIVGFRNAEAVRTPRLITAATTNWNFLQPLFLSGVFSKSTLISDSALIFLGNSYKEEGTWIFSISS